MTENSNENRSGEITRRDFVGGTLLGAGAALLTSAAPLTMRPALAQSFEAPLNDLPPEWSGPGGIGDYAGKNGNTASVVNAGHGMVRDGLLMQRLQQAEPVDDLYDLVIVGSGISGLASAYVFQKAQPAARILILDQHDIFGGEAKLNEFEVDGHLLHGPQGSTVTNLFPDYPFLAELQLQKLPPFVQPRNTHLAIPWNSWGPMLWTQTYFDQAFYFEGRGFIKNPWRDNLAHVPFPDKLKKALLQVIEYKHTEPVADVDALLDSMTYKQFLLDYVKVPADVVDDVCGYFDQAFAAAGCYRSAWMSAYSANFLALPGVVNYGNPTPFFYNQSFGQSSEEFKDIVRSGQFPGGNAHIARRFLKLGKPEALAGEYNFADVEYGKVRWDRLDNAGDRYRLRLSSTVFSVAHNDKPDRSTHVVVTYGKQGRVYSVRGKRVICAGQQHVNRRICRDISPEIRTAMQAFHHQPIMVVNIALRNWRFLEKIGAASVRWFEGFGWFTSLHQSFDLNGRAESCDPGEPVVLTLFVPFFAGSETDTYDKVATYSRMMMFAMPFAQVEKEVRAQFTKMFAPHGFNADRDIAGIVANRQGHAYSINPPGFHIGRNGKKSPIEILQQPYHRMAFSHSELHGHQAWNTAAEQGKRAAEQMLAVKD